MRKSLVILLLIFSVSKGSGQQRTAYAKGGSVLMVGYGFGNLWKQFLEEGVSFPQFYTVQSTGPFALTYEYGLLKNISLGIAAGYSRLKGEYNYNGFILIDRLDNLSLLARANYHLRKWPKFDIYGGGGIGYLHFTYKAFDDSGQPIGLSKPVPGEFGFSLQAGCHYYFSPHFGIYTEAGYVAGAIGQAGLSIRL